MKRKVSSTSAKGKNGNGTPNSEPKEKTIKDRIKELEENVRLDLKRVRDPGDTNTLGNELRDKAMAVILKSAGTREWDAYMKLFGFSEEQLERLVPNYSDGEKNEALAYLVGGGVCGNTSVDMTGISTRCGLFGRVDDAIENR